ncbi:respiratory nitrate reductase subunit gamma [Thalassobacillus pellis]|uniref:respiratory nitrate reductase subunit gamma n=1 Tax=Thalassobacillus pellis TaxID=748008 RepID=UPI001960DC28|nr:respiratory nitrate reductase subunit gamma [Thalassobacillus pellis]MBM7551961.1 nitrate reductase gamma subunit [Thalassobacillus pellis]
MTPIDFLLWVAYPYITLTIFIVGHIYRYNHDQFGWSAQSSQFLKSDPLLKWGSILFHYAVIFVFFGHIGGIVVPQSFYPMIGVTEEMYHFGAVWFGGLAGAAMVIGGALLTARRLKNKRVNRNSSRKDLFVLLLLGVVTVVGFTNTAWYTATGGEFDYRDTIGPWFRGILSFRPMPEMLATAPWGFQAHVLAAFTLFAVWPFTRLVHVWSLPLEYIKRRYIIYRRGRTNPERSKRA